MSIEVLKEYYAEEPGARAPVLSYIRNSQAIEKELEEKRKSRVEELKEWKRIYEESKRRRNG